MTRPAPRDIHREVEVEVEAEVGDGGAAAAMAPGHAARRNGEGRGPDDSHHTPYPHHTDHRHHTSDRPPGSLDGNAAAGDLQLLFGTDMTTASGRCQDCGRQVLLAEAHECALQVTRPEGAPGGARLRSVFPARGRGSWSRRTRPGR
ncbi:DUF6510 family protein [Streptomyces sp. bgisy022]|uniref:DUF6510 family protein n=1 Tax=Streptomyces sp. bgisy022 TaxID=3413769 RepID=UPI003D74CC9A